MCLTIKSICICATIFLHLIGRKTVYFSCLLLLPGCVKFRFPFIVIFACKCLERGGGDRKPLVRKDYIVRAQWNNKRFSIFFSCSSVVWKKKIDIDLWWEDPHNISKCINRFWTLYYRGIQYHVRDVSSTIIGLYDK